MQARVSGALLSGIGYWLKLTDNEKKPPEGGFNLNLEPGNETRNSRGLRAPAPTLGKVVASTPQNEKSHPRCACNLKLEAGKTETRTRGPRPWPRSCSTN